MHLLETSGLTKRFGGLTVMNDLDFSMEEGEIKGFLGPNGAGKSTFFNLITGVLTPSSGHIFYAGKEITKSKPHQVAKMGIGRTFQLNPLFGEFTVFENVTAAYHLRPHSTACPQRAGQEPAPRLPEDLGCGPGPGHQAQAPAA